MRTTFAVLAALALLSGCTSSRTDLAMGPYVNSVDDSSARILWITEPDLPGMNKLTLEDPAPGVRMSNMVSLIEGAREVRHTVTVTGLPPNAEQRYVVTAGRDSVAASFRTAPRPGEAVPFRFIAYGDTRSRPDEHRKVMKAMAGEAPLALVLHTGDLVANGTVWSLWKKEFFDPASPVLEQAALWPALGNHEVDGKTYQNIFDLPGNGRWYSFDYGDVHFVVLDTSLDPDGMPPGSPEMLEWFEKDLAANRSKWIVCSFHNPIFNIGGHATRWGQETFLPVMEKYGVDVVVTGHSHLYERFRPIGQPGGKPIMHIVAGGGGAPIYQAEPSPILAARYAGLNYCVFDVDGDRMTMTAKTPEGRVLDQFTLIKKDGRYQDEIMAQTVPTELARKIAFVLAGLTADFPDVPIPGAEISIVLAPGVLPMGSHVRITSAKDHPWQIQTLEADVTGDPLVLKARVPQDLKLLIGGFSPGVRVDLTVTYEGQTYHRDGTPVRPSWGTVRRLTPAPVPVRVPEATTSITIDGDLADWADMPPLLVPTRAARSPITKMAWRADGLYVAMDVPDDDVQPSAQSPWTADCVEVFIESDNARSKNAKTKRNEAAMKFDVSPLSVGDGNTALVNVAYGRAGEGAAAIAAAWKKTDKGYILEFRVPAEALAPAVLEDGTQMGFHYILHNGPKTTEVFWDTTGKSGVWVSPITWGAIRLKATAPVAE